MPANTFGSNFVVSTWGESHGEALGAIVDGCPAGIKLSEADIQKELNRRRPAEKSKVSTTRREKDEVKILSGVFEGKTTGTPISMIVFNKDTRSQDYSNIKDKFRPGHADYTYHIKYNGHNDYRGGGRSSGRETISRVMAGAIAKKVLKEKYNIEIFGHTLQIAEIKATNFNKAFIEKNELKTADQKAYKEMIKKIEEVRFKSGDTLGATIEIIVKNAPAGLGNPVFDKLDADLAKAMISIGAIKGIEFGSGFDSVNMTGSEHNDQMKIKGSKIDFLSNHAGGILGGISTGADITMRLAVKPVPSTSIELQTITENGKNTTIKTLGRHDCCLAPRIIPVAESMAAIVILDKALQC
ncbi:chorismate synthase [Candidatus Peregrinibacteria bacterium CG10_big_fil_rev_8_21_14_0_10_36_19]|nr:MAG: chorismate synthase [Candidatus Peregrinibacteria bacterium CG10_big_fil_rev_8_21_14_0_10_36_19]